MPGHSLLRATPKILAALALLTLTACGDSLSDCPLAEDYDESLVSEVLDPSGDEYAANHANRTHKVYEPTGTPRSRLVVHLPGLNNEPGNQTAILKTAAYGGFRAIGLVWTNGTLAADDCASDPNFDDCLTTTREARGFGSDPETVETELVDLLTQLDTDHPGGGWGGFLTGGLPDWSQIVLAGYSEGGNQAAYMAKQVEVCGVVLISGGGNFGTPPPNTSGDPLAAWMTQPGATPGNQHYALYHEGEGFSADYVRAYDAIGVPTNSFSRVAEDQQSAGWPDFDLARRLVVHDLTSPSATAVPYPQCDPHGTTVPDSCLDYGLGEPTYDLLKAHLYLFCCAGDP